MSQSPSNLDLPGEPWLTEPAPPSRGSARRQVGMGVLLFVLSAIIWGYWTLTDASRVRAMAETYLSEILGGHVRVERAELSLFEGLRLEGVSVRVDDRGMPDSLIFTARAFHVRPSLRALLAGRVEASQLTALDPQVNLCENLDTGEWNYLRLKRAKSAPRAKRPGEKESKPIVLPQVLLRAGRIEYSRISHGRHQVLGTRAIDGQLNPIESAGHQYAIDLESRAADRRFGPRLLGVLDMDQLSVSAQVHDLVFDSTVLAMLPQQIQEVMNAHHLAGQVTILKFTYNPGRKGEPDFRVEVELKHGGVAILPRELLSLSKREYEQAQRHRFVLPVAAMSRFNVIGYPDALEQIMRLPPLELADVSGRVVFTPQRIRFSLRGQLAGNSIFLNGAIDGYHPKAPLHIQVTAPNLNLPPRPAFLPSLPEEVRTIYSDVRPAGKGNLTVQLVRRVAGEELETPTVQLQVVDGSFCFYEFPYPLIHASGLVEYGWDPENKRDRLRLIGIKAQGIPGTKNASTWAEVDGTISPLKRHSGIDMLIRSRDFRLDEHVRAALPIEARPVVGMFDVRQRNGEAGIVTAPMEVHGDMTTRVKREAGPRHKLTVEVDLDIREGRGEYALFPYPLRNVTGQVLVRPGYVEIPRLLATEGDASLEISGKVSFGRNQPAAPDLKIVARNVPVGEDLRSSLPRQQRQWLEKMALRGTLDVDGSIFLTDANGLRVIKPARAAALGEASVDWDLRLRLREGQLWPVGEQMGLTDLAGELRLSRARLELERAQAKRGGAAVTGEGFIAWADDRPSYSIRADARGLKADEVLYNMIPAEAQRSWLALRPEGTMDLHVQYGGQIDDQVEAENQFEVTIKPRELSITPGAFPWTMDRLEGALTVSSKGVMLENIVARHGDATLHISGTGSTTGPAEWDLSGRAEGVVVDDELRRAAPAGLASFFKSIHLEGKVSMDVTELKYRAAEDLVQMRTKVTLSEGSIDAGLPMTAIEGGGGLSITLRGGDLHALSGQLDVASLVVAQRPVTNLQSRIVKPAGEEIYQFADLRATLAGGELAGQIDLYTPKAGPSRYAVAADLRQLDVMELVGEREEKIKGKLSARVSLEGNWDDARSRRGGGLVEMQGKELYRIPVLLGLLQITNLALPIKSPFKEGTISYSVEGEKLIFERIELRAESMLMQGSGKLDFGTKKVSMTFRTNNPKWPTIPVIGEIIQVAKDDMFQIRVTGTVQEPLVRGQAMRTLTTTVDEVLAGDAKPVREPKKPKGK